MVDGDEHNKVDNQPGVIGMYPSMSIGEEKFIYESQTVRTANHDQVSKMGGHFTFVITEGPKKGESFDAKIDDFHTKIPEDYELIKTPSELRLDSWDE